MTHQHFLNKFTIAILLICHSCFSHAQHLSLSNLTCEYKADPMGVESASPHLGWVLQSDQRSVVQTAYRILVADDTALLKNDVGNIWDSKKVTASTSIQVAYMGKKLLPVNMYYWKVMVWTNKNMSSLSSQAKWQTGLFTPADWKGAKWIAYERLADSNSTVLPTDGKADKLSGTNILPLLRKDFSVSGPVEKATLFICGLGQFEVNINGKKTGDHFLDPGWTKYDKQALYVPFDVTQQLQQGKNAIGVLLGNGFYYVPPVASRYRKLKSAFGYPKMICRLVIRYKDGNMENIVSDGSWKTAPGPITFSSIYGGEDYNANLEQKGWDEPSFKDQLWKKVLIVDGPAILNAQMTDPVKIMDTFSPVKITQPQPGIWVYDLGQNASAIPQIKVRGRKGDTIRIIPAELLNDNGTANQKASGSPSFFEYILKGEGTESWQPRFTYYGFRYLQVKGGMPSGENNAAHVPEIIELKGMHIRNSTESTGSFTCSNELFNRTYTLIDWAIKSNMMSLFTDCPHREKLGWLEQTHLMGPSVRYSYNIAALCRKAVQDMKYSQTPEGLVPEIAPEYVKFDWGNGMFRDSPEWGSSSILVPWYMYQWYGDTQVLEQSYSMMQRYIGYLQTKAVDHILSQGLGDWYDIGPQRPGVSQLTPMGITGTAIYYYDLTILIKIAALLRKPKDVSLYGKLAGEVRKSFNAKFFNRQTKQYGTGSQTANAMAVYMNLVEPAYKEAVVNNIVKDLQGRNNSLTAGDIGYRYLLRVLDDEGRSDIIYNMNSRADVPGYGYQLAKGATALTESWQAYPSVSNNHFMLGHLMEWFYSGLGGIRPAADAIAFNKIEIRPEPVGDVHAARATYYSPYGLISSEWKKENKRFWLEVTIPANTDAVIYIPAGYTARITENGKPVSMDRDVQLSGNKNGKTVIHIGSGKYTFEAWIP